MTDNGGTTLVTGASGCLGAWTVRELMLKGERVLCFDQSGDRRRLKLLMDEKEAGAVPWITGDIRDFEAVQAAVSGHGVRAIVHMAALQVPFCRSNPVAATQVNVGGLVNVLEAARLHRVPNVVYASSIAALPVDEAASGFTTLYGAFKAADEAIANAYWNEFQAPSIGLRPAPIFGVGRDQGMTSLPTVAMLAAVLDVPFTIPFTGRLVFQHAQDVAKAFIGCLALAGGGARVYNLGGEPIDVSDIVSAIRDVVPAAEIRSAGNGLPLPVTIDDGPIRAAIGEWQATSPLERIRGTVSDFRALLKRGLVGASDIAVSAEGLRAS